MEQFAVKTNGLTRLYGANTAVDHLNLKVQKGQIFGFLGHNGAGKTTTIRMLTTLLSPTDGNAEIFGADIVKENLQVRKQIGYVPENVHLYKDLTVWENMKFFAALSSVPESDRRILEILECIGHPEWIDFKVGTLSKGMRQRIGIAQALLHKPSLLFLDEPASGLDPEGTRDIGDLIVQLNREEGITIFMNTHQLGEVAKLCTHIGILNHGHMVIADSLENILKKFPDHASLEDIYLQIEKDRKVIV